MFRKGIYLSLVTAVISGFSIFANQFFVTQADPLAFTTVRNLLVTIGLTAVLLITKKHKRLLKLSKKDWIKLGLIGFIGGGVPFALFFSGLSQIGATQGNLIHKSLFIWVAVLTIPLLGERLSKWQIVGYLSIISATFVIGVKPQLALNFGSLLVLAATLLWAVENVIAKIALRKVPAEVVGWARILFGLPMLIGITIVMGKGQLLISSETLAWGKLLTSAGFLVAYVLTWYSALSYAPATLVSSVLAFAPVVTTLLTGIFVTGDLNSVQTGVILLLTLGVGLVISKIIKPQSQKAWI